MARSPRPIEAGGDLPGILQRGEGDGEMSGQLRPIVAQTFPLADARRAYEEGLKGHARGKIVLTVP